MKLQRFALLLFCLWGDAALAADQARPLRVLLTNDDGFTAPGIRAELAALKDAGFDVTLVAPRENQSGSGMRVTTTPLTYREESPDVWVVDGSPADAAAVGIQVVMKDAPPDVVVSGANLGQNAGRTANISGTVGAATMAAQLGVPAVAVSVGIDMGEAKAAPKPFPTTLSVFPQAAQFTAALVGQLRASAGSGPLLPPGALLNVNYPALTGAAPKGVKLAAHGKLDAYAFDFKPTGKPNEVKLTLGPRTAQEPQPEHADTTLFDAGYVTITVLDGDWGAPAAVREATGQRLAPLLR